MDVLAIVYEDVRVSSQQDIEATVKSNLHDSAEHVSLDSVEDDLVCGNDKGFRVLESQAKLERDVKSSRVKEERQERLNNSYEIRFKEHEIRFKELEDRMRGLVTTSEGYLILRRRFIDVFKRDVKGFDMTGSTAIREGNAVAHHGDAIADAIMFDQDNRTDDSIFEELYGLNPRQVLKYRTYTHVLLNESYFLLIICIESGSDDHDLFRVLNRHATMVAENKPLSKEIKVAFEIFLVQVKGAWLQPPAKDPNSPLGRAYYALWDILRGSV